jgi:hypothetical protein
MEDTSQAAVRGHRNRETVRESWSFSDWILVLHRDGVHWHIVWHAVSAQCLLNEGRSEKRW